MSAGHRFVRPIMPSPDTRRGGKRKRAIPATTPRAERRRMFHACAINPAAPPGARTWGGWRMSGEAPRAANVRELEAANTREAILAASPLHKRAVYREHRRPHPAKAWLVAQRARWAAWNEAAANAFKLRTMTGKAEAPTLAAA